MNENWVKKKKTLVNFLTKNVVEIYLVVVFIRLVK